MLFVMGGIFFLSHQSGNSLHLPGLPGIDKVLHALAYMALGLSYAVAFSDSAWLRHPRKLQCAVVCLCCMYGITDEVHQMFVSGRMASGADVIADVIGGAAAAVLYVSLYRKGRHTLDERRS